LFEVVERFVERMSDLSTVTAHDPHQPMAIVVVDLTHPHTLGHRPV
jgi:hypothetical protein